MINKHWTFSQPRTPFKIWKLMRMNTINPCLIFPTLSLNQSSTQRNFYDLQDKFKRTTNCNTQGSSLNYEPVNLGTEQNPCFINLGFDCSNEEIIASIKLCKEFKYIFAWMYDEPKTFDTGIMYLNIPMKPEVRP